MRSRWEWQQPQGPRADPAPEFDLRFWIFHSSSPLLINVMGCQLHRIVPKSLYEKMFRQKLFPITDCHVLSIWLINITVSIFCLILNISFPFTTNNRYGLIDLVSLLKSMEEGLKTSKMTNKLENPEHGFREWNLMLFYEPFWLTAWCQLPILRPLPENAHHSYQSDDLARL